MSEMQVRFGEPIRLELGNTIPVPINNYNELINKPQINGQELTGNRIIKMGDLEDNVGYLTEETDPTVPAWAKEPEKPAYTPEEIGAYRKPANGIPLSDIEAGVIPDVSAKMNANLKGAPYGVAELDGNGLVPSYQLPSYVDDVKSYPSMAFFPTTGEDDKIYVDKSTNKQYRWDGTSYIEIASSLALGETDHTAYRGDRGKAAYDHALTKGTAYESGLYKIATNSEGHVSSAILVTKSDIEALGFSGGGGGSEIDDTAGAGDTDKAWSANKLVTEFAKKYEKPNDGIPSSDLASGVIPNVPVTGVRVNNVSVVTNKIANIPIATGSSVGVARFNSSYGLQMIDNDITAAIYPATSSFIKAGGSQYSPITPQRQHEAVFYGLTKAAGQDMKDSSNAVGTYTDDAKAAIRSMIGAENGDDIVKVQDTQPQTSATKIWFPETAPESVQVPTYAEHTALMSALNGKVDEPSSEGTSGQVLTTDGNGGRSWTTVQGGGSVTVDDAFSTTSENPVQNKVITNFVGTTDVGDHIEEVEKLSFANSSVTIQTVSVKTFTDNKVTVSGTATSQALRTLQDNISLTAGKYRFSIDSPILSSGYQIQLFNITGNAVVFSFTSTSKNKQTFFTIDSAGSYRIRVLLPTSDISDTQKVSLVNLKTVDSTLSFATKELISEVDDFANRIKQKCKLIEDAGNIITVNETAITFSNANIKNDNTILFSKEAKRITATADGGWVKFSFGGDSYDFDTVTVVFYLPYESYSSTSPTSVELRIYANGTGNTPIVSTSNCCWGWNYLKIPKSKTGLSANTKINAVVIMLKTTSGTTESEFGEIIVDSIILDMKMKPTFILDLDQIWEKSIDNGAYAYCRTNNVPYTIHTWQYANLNSAKVTEMKTAMLNGCEFSYYGGYTNESAMDEATSYSGAIAECELMENDIVPFTHKRFLTYGCGAHRMNQYLRESLEANGVKAIRGRWIANPIGYFSELNTWLPYSIEISYENSTVQQIKDHIDEAVTNGSCVVAFTHGVCNDDETVLGVSSSAIKLTDFKSVIDYLVNLRNHGQIQICTMEQFVNQCLI